MIVDAIEAFTARVRSRQVGQNTISGWGTSSSSPWSSSPSPSAGSAPAARFVAEELAAHLADPADPEAFVFTARQGGPLRVTGFRARVGRPATRAAGLDGLRIHDLRHTAVALWIAAGANPKEVAARAGHASVSFTLDRYGHLYPEADTALRDRLDGLYGTAQPAPASTVVHLRRRAGRGPSVAPGGPGDDESAADNASTTL